MVADAEERCPWTFADFCLWVYVLVDDLWPQVAPLCRRPGPAPAYSDPELVTMVLVGEAKGWHEETVLAGEWAAHRDLIPVQPERSRRNRRRRQLAGPINQLRRLLLTHYHFDHMGAAAELRAKLGCAVHGSPLTARVLATGDEAAISLPGAKAAGYVPADYRLQACPAVGDLTEGASFTVGRLRVTVYDTPGHAAGHVSFLVEGGERTLLLQGDVVFHGGTIFLQNVPDCSIQDYGESVRKLAALAFDAHLPGHLAISLRDGKRHIDAAAAQFAKLMVPRNLI